MATLGTNTLKISDIIRRSKANGELSLISEMLNQRNGMADDARWQMGDTPGGHMATQRVALPTWSTVNPNGTTGLAKSVTSQTLEPVEHIAVMSEIEQLVGTYGPIDISAKQASENVAFVEAGKQTISSRWVSGNGTTTPGQVNGLAVRYNSTTGVNGRNVITAGALTGQTDCMSIYMIEWGDRKIYPFYPQGSQGGIQINPFPMRISDVTSTTRRVVWTTQFLWSFGLAVDDWRSVARVCNIDKSLLVAGTGADLFDKLTIAYHNMPPGNGDGRAIYMNRTTRAMFDIQARNDVQSGGQLTYAMVDGMMMEVYRGIPVNLEDQLTESESVVT
jgi:hypothetical protein